MFESETKESFILLVPAAELTAVVGVQLHDAGNCRTAVLGTTRLLAAEITAAVLTPMMSESDTNTAFSVATTVGKFTAVCSAVLHGVKDLATDGFGTA